MLKKLINHKPATAHQTYLVSLSLLAVHLVALMLVMWGTHFTVVL